ncbi:MAG: M28 family peptidase [Acidiferrobacterales bacterium]
MAAPRRPGVGVHRRVSHNVVEKAAATLAALVMLIIAPVLHGIKPGKEWERDMSVKRLSEHVHTLAGEIGERNMFHPPALREAADYIDRVWSEQGYEVARYAYDVNGEEATNLEATREGNDRANEIILVGAHYDSVIGSPGANDNGTGIAALLELSRHFFKREPARSVRFVAFTNEEPPFFKTNTMGSRVYVKRTRSRGDNVLAMLCLETIGFYSDEPDSQHYPPLFSLFYPDTGNFIGFVSNFRSRSLLMRSVTAFRAASDFPIEYASTFAFIPGVDWSDHGSFWREGVPAIMITDTALYRYPHYHTARDTPDKVSYDHLASVTEGLIAVIESLANPNGTPRDDGD